MCFDNTHFDDIELKKPDLYDFFKILTRKLIFVLIKIRFLNSNIQIRGTPHLQG